MGHAQQFYHIEQIVKPNVLPQGNDRQEVSCYNGAMANPRHDWYLKEWLKALGVSQQWVADRLDLQKSKISRKASGVTPYEREDINSISALLYLEPYELLMHPADAMNLRQLRETAVSIASDNKASIVPKLRAVGETVKRQARG